MGFLSGCPSKFTVEAGRSLRIAEGRSVRPNSLDATDGLESSIQAYPLGEPAVVPYRSRFVAMRGEAGAIAALSRWPLLSRRRQAA